MYATVVLGLLVGVAGATPTIAQPSTPAAKPVAQGDAKLAPVDEQFGRYGQSVIEVRNRLKAIAAKADAGALEPGDVGAIDYAGDGALAWQRRYPADPWLANALSQLVCLYARAGAASDTKTVQAFTSLATQFPNSAEEARAVFGLWSAPPVVGVGGQVVAQTTGVPVAGAVVLLVANADSSELDSAAFATTASDGAFYLRNVTFSSAQYVVVEPPRGSQYAVYRAKVAVIGGKPMLGVIRLAAR